MGPNLVTGALISSREETQTPTQRRTHVKTKAEANTAVESHVYIVLVW